MKKITLMMISIAALSLHSCQEKKEGNANSTEKAASQTPISGSQSVVSDGDKKTSENTPKAAIKFNDLVYDFGKAKEGEKVTHVYKFTNTGNNPLIIESAKPSCGCTIPTFPKEPIAPGGTGEIIAEFDSNGRPGDTNKTINIIANTEPATTMLTLKGFVIGKAPQNGDMSNIKGPINQ